MPEDNGTQAGPVTANLLRLSLLENSHSFLVEALKKALAGESTPDEWKFAILHACQAIELSLKERLAREHPSLIMADVDKPRRTVTPDVAMARLRRYCNVAFRDADRAAILQAIEWRHSIVHHEVALDVAQAKTTFAVLLGFLMHFHQSVLRDELSDALPEQLWLEALAVRQYGEEALRRAREHMQAEGLAESDAITCSKCGLDTFVSTGDLFRCFACGAQEEVGECEACHRLVPRSYLRALNDYLDEEDGFLVIYICDDCYNREPDWP